MQLLELGIYGFKLATRLAVAGRAAVGASSTGSRATNCTKLTAIATGHIARSEQRVCIMAMHYMDIERRMIS